MSNGGTEEERAADSLVATALPLHVRAQQCDPQQEVHHDGAHHHGQP